MNNNRVAVWVMMVWAAACGQAFAGFMGPSRYSEFGDSPYFTTPLVWFHLENFEDGALNTPGVTVDNGLVVGNLPTTDSVDEDDGLLDGMGVGSSLTSVAGADGVNSFMFTFQPSVLGTYPTHVGLVFTDGAPNGFITYEPFDQNGLSLGTLNAFVGDDSFNGLTLEDTFFGAVHAEGISRMSITDNGNAFDLELDHLQYGSIVPEPSSVVLALVAAGAGLAVWRFRGDRKWEIGNRKLRKVLVG
jgi:hypothetical protein